MLAATVSAQTYNLRTVSGYANATTSTHFAIQWNAKTAAGLSFDATKAQTMLTNLEASYNKHVTQNGFRAPYASATVKYKVNTYIGDTGLQGGCDGTDPVMYVAPGNETNTWGLSHELTHALQCGTDAFTNRTTGGGPIHEQHANWMAHQEYPAIAHCSELSVREAQYHWDDSRNMYCNWQFLEYLKEHQGGAATVNNLWMSSLTPAPGTALANDDDPIRALMRNKGWSFSQLGDVWGDFALHMARADFSNGTVYRAAWWENRAEEFLRLQQIALNPLDVANNRYVVPFEMAPQRYANNIVRLYPNTATATINVAFQGVVQTKNNVSGWSKKQLYDPDSVSLPGSNWHYGFAVVDTSSSTPKFRYVGPFSGTSGTMSVQPTATEQVFLVVSATPTNRHLLIWDQFYYTIYRYPWMVQVDGAKPEGAQPSAYSTTGIAGKTWSNGGGFVANTATVASTVTVGPLARVLGSAKVSGSAQILGRATVKGSAQISGNAIVTDTAIVTGSAIVSEYATISGHAYLNTGTISGSAQVKGWATITTNQNAQGITVSGSAILGGVALPFGPAKLSGTAQVLGDAEMYGVTASKGVFYGLVDDDVVADATQGANLTAPMPEVTLPPPYAWPSSIATSSSSVTVSSSSVAVSSSSSNIVSSSSFAVPSSSSSIVSSSSVAVSSSSVTGSCIAFVNGIGNYGSNCYKSGLTSMAASTCYTMNPARGLPAPTWINGDASQTYWWSVTACSTATSSSSSSKASSSSVAVSSSSVIISSSSNVVSSSSLAVSSSSSKASSSSVAVSSSSVILSSSSSVVSSSSVTSASNCIAFVNGQGNYNSNCYSSGLANMAASTCYTMNPARDLPAPQWINNSASDSYWWAITTCVSNLSKKPSTAASTTPLLNSTLPSSMAPQSRFVLFNSLGQQKLISPRDGSLMVLRADGTLVLSRSVSRNEAVSLQLPSGIYLLNWK